MRLLFIILSFIFGVTTVNAQSVLFPNRGGTGTSTVPAYGQVLVGNSSGTYTPTATSSLGITSTGGGTGSNWLYTTNYGAQALTPSTTIAIWLKAPLYASTTGIFGSTVTASSIIATSTTASSTFYKINSPGQLDLGAGGDGLDVNILGSYGTTNNSTGGWVYLKGGNAILGNANGGSISQTGGAGAGNGAGGNVLITGGISGATSGGTGGNIELITGPSTGSGTVGEIQFFANGVRSASNQLFTFTNAGKVGIGTTSPYAPLSVVGQVVGSYFTATSTTASQFPTASTTNLTISKIYDNSGSLGTNGSVLQTNGSVSSWVSTSSLGILNSASTTLLRDANTWTGSNTIAASLLNITGLSNGCIQISSNILTSTGSACGSGGGSSMFATSSSPILSLIPNSGNNVGLGLGTTTPRYTLQVASTTKQIAISSTNSINTPDWILSNNGGEFTLGTSSPTTFATSTKSSFTLDGGGNLTMTGKNFIFGDAIASATCSILTCLSLWGNDNTINGVQIGVGNKSAGSSAYNGFFLNNNLADNNVTHYGFLGQNSSTYTDTTFGTGYEKSQVFLQNTDGLVSFISSTSTDALHRGGINFLTGGSNSTNERMMITTAGRIGISSSTPAGFLSVSATSSSATTPLFVVASSTNAVNSSIFMIDSAGHAVYGGGTPAVSSCGTGSPSVVGNDNGGTITVGNASPTACTLTFKRAWSTNPVCHFETVSGGSGGHNITSLSTTAITVTFGTTPGNGSSIYYSCGLYTN